MVNTSGSVKGVTCWISGKKPGKKKDIPLASNAITDGMLPTKQFGNLQITPENNINSNGLYMAIGSDKLKSFGEYLQQ
jgi:catabolite regulation protein CreA